MLWMSIFCFELPLNDSCEPSRSAEKMCSVASSIEMKAPVTKHSDTPKAFQKVQVFNWWPNWLNIVAQSFSSYSCHMEPFTRYFRFLLKDFSYFSANCVWDHNCPRLLPLPLSKVWQKCDILATNTYGEESAGWISLYKLVLIFFCEDIRKRQFFWKNWLVNEFRTTMGGGLLGVSKKVIAVRNS